MPVPRRRHSPARRDRARTHKKLAKPNATPCPKCHQPKPSHRACPHCGTYKNGEYKVIVND
jgi:large subunit ribosomal protein L32